MSFSFWIPWEIEMLGGNEFRLRQGFAFGKTLVRRKSAAAQKGRRAVFQKNSPKDKSIYFLTVLSM